MRCNCLCREHHLLDALLHALDRAIAAVCGVVHLGFHSAHVARAVGKGIIERTCQRRPTRRCGIALRYRAGAIACFRQRGARSFCGGMESAADNVGGVAEVVADVAHTISTKGVAQRVTSILEGTADGACVLGRSGCDATGSGLAVRGDQRATCAHTCARARPCPRARLRRARGRNNTRPSRARPTNDAIVLADAMRERERLVELCELAELLNHGAALLLHTLEQPLSGRDARCGLTPAELGVVPTVVRSSQRLHVGDGRVVVPRALGGGPLGAHSLLA
mmetsp:Transcript_6455/g.26212  ORF Transcript_6455/g.26212 Transcript_6455/m.26212 type:complete len:279 (+) Transcript_6455:3533-4369(+)